MLHAGVVAGRQAACTLERGGARQRAESQAAVAGDAGVRRAARAVARDEVLHNGLAEGLGHAVRVGDPQGAGARPASFTVSGEQHERSAAAAPGRATGASSRPPRRSPRRAAASRPRRCRRRRSSPPPRGRRAAAHPHRAQALGVPCLEGPRHGVLDGLGAVATGRAQAAQIAVEVVGRQPQRRSDHSPRSGGRRRRWRPPSGPRTRRPRSARRARARPAGVGRRGPCRHRSRCPTHRRRRPPPSHPRRWGTPSGASPHGGTAAPRQASIARFVTPPCRSGR